MAQRPNRPTQRISRIRLSNWRNFKQVDVATPSRLFIVGPNASGKSNLLDALRFLRDLAIDEGGLQSAVNNRGGLSRVRNLAARNIDGGHVRIAVEISDGSNEDTWSYDLALKAEQRGRRRALVASEVVKRNGRILLSRPDTQDDKDLERLTQTALEQVNANQEFRTIAELFADVRYLHLVPQVIRESGRGSSKPNDPFGGDFLERVARLGSGEQQRRLKRINAALQLAVPQLDSLQLVRDEDKRPHLEARYKHWRPQGARQDEHDFSDGTLRLIGLLWSLQEKGAKGPILLEEPELSLHPEIVRQLPAMIAGAIRGTGNQVFATTHAHDILDGEGLGLDEVVMLRTGKEGTEAVLLADWQEVRDRVDSGFDLREALGSALTPESIRALSRTPIA